MVGAAGTAKTSTAKMFLNKCLAIHGPLAALNSASLVLFFIVYYTYNYI